MRRARAGLSMALALTVSTVSACDSSTPSTEPTTSPPVTSTVAHTSTAASTEPTTTVVPTIAPETTPIATLPALTAGSLDASFGSGGKVTTRFTIDGATAYAMVSAIALDAEGRLVAVGAITNEQQVRLGVARYLPDGTLDPTFGTGGRAVSSIHNTPSGLLVLPDGALLLTGTATSESSGEQLFLARFREDGTLDPSFGVGGQVTTRCGSDPCSPFGSPARQADGMLLVGAGIPTDTEGVSIQVMMRLGPDGTLDPTYGTGGVATIGTVTGVGAGTVLDALGRAVVAAGSSDGNARLVRLTTDGVLDPTFGTVGSATVDLQPWIEPSAPGVRPAAGFAGVGILPDGRIVATGSVSPDPGADASEIFVARFDPDGHLDPQFGTGGVTVTPPSGIAYPAALLIDSKGEALVAGVDGGVVFVGRYGTSGQLDDTFGDHGVARVDFGGPGPSGATAMLQLDDGHLVVAGYAFLSAADGKAEGYAFALARLTP